MVLSHLNVRGRWRPIRGGQVVVVAGAVFHNWGDGGDVSQFQGGDEDYHEVTSTSGGPANPIKLPAGWMAVSA